ncbi:hypothetical protein [Streptomyces sp. NPDC007074]|uniref:hypothetical protein n=1 Tax=Streptomyces sp. NPDC007074 TaxID=3156764 RepID=UPI0033C14D25
MTNSTTTDVTREPRARVPAAPPGSTDPTTRVATLSQALGAARPGGAVTPPARPRVAEPGRAPGTQPARPGPTLPGPALPGPAFPGAVRPEPVRPEPVRPEPVRVAARVAGRTGDTGTSPTATAAPTERAPRPGGATETAPPAFPRTGRGRHRRPPRPRRALFAVGGLALAAGALSLARLAPDGVTGGGGGAEAEPRPGVAGDGPLDASPTVWAVPSAHPASAGGPAAAGGPGATPTAAPSPGATASPTSTGPAGAAGGVTAPSAAVPGGARPTGRADTPVGDEPDTTGIPTEPVTSQPPAAPAPHPTPSATTPAPAPKPGSPGLCVPIVGICVNSLTAPLGHG